MKLLEITQTHIIIEDPHLLFIGANGHRTYGITVKSLRPKSEVEKRGYAREWNINDYSISRGDLSFLGLSSDEKIKLKADVLRMAREQQ